MPKQHSRKPRSFAIHIDPSNLKEYEGVALDFNTQKVVGVKDGQSFPLIGKNRIEYKRSRDNKVDKILHASSSPSADTWFSTNHQLLAYDHLIAVDTNTNHLNGSDVSITAAYHVIPRSREPEQAFCHARVIAIFESWNVQCKPENLGWWQILHAIQQQPEDFTGSIGLVVDSDLGKHQAFNDRTEPIVSDFYLPENVTIIYGSDKGGAEHLSTKLIKYCHNLAADLFKNQNLVMNTDNLHSGLEGVYTHFRQWDTEQMDLRSFCKIKDLNS